MRRIERTNVFRRDFKREKRGQHRSDLDAALTFTVSLLVEDKPLPERNRDHPLAGEYRECHLKPDLLLIYRKPDAEVLQLIRLGSHGELFSRRQDNLPGNRPDGLSAHAIICLRLNVCTSRLIL
jgi:mRNA interferase YafQ